ncbi:hypothetical protein [Moritella viscosa]|uniref:Transcriptional regulator, GntR family n=1 Tax=Moritella viscosa TaxID=80854 RepID=A0A1L0C7Z0_9GAMM|nr:hypothetical protein [Moritella viscosa]SGZ17314.1 Transcriptional regulator, GntR family [Moritella viscosa]
MRTITEDAKDLASMTDDEIRNILCGISMQGAKRFMNEVKLHNAAAKYDQRVVGKFIRLEKSIRIRCLRTGIEMMATGTDILDGKL